MACLASLVPDAWDVLGTMLDTLQFARLFMTGDCRVQASICGAKTRRFVYTRRMLVTSDLVHHLLIGGAREVTLPTPFLDLADFGKFSSIRLRRLCLSYNQCGPIHMAELRGLDLSSLTTLESFESCRDYVVRQSLKLPPSVTSVKIGFSQCDEPLGDLSLLPNLTELSVESGVFHGHHFVKAARWPPHLQSLSISVNVPIARTARKYMPSSLTELKLSAVTRISMDITWLAEKCPHLRTLAAPDVYIDGPLPPSLTSLEVGDVHIRNTSSVKQTMGYIPKSVTAFDFDSLDIDDIGTNYERQALVCMDIYEGVVGLLPQLDLQSIEAAIFAISHRFSVAVPGLTDALRRHLEPYGLDGRYLEWIKSRERTWRGELRTYAVISLVDSGLSDMGMANVLEDRCIVCDDVGADASLAHQEYALLELEKGMTSIMYLRSSYKPLAKRLPPDAICHLNMIIVEATAFGPLCDLVAKNDLAWLARIVVVGHTVDAMISAIQSCASRLPKLRQVVLHLQATPVRPYIAEPLGELHSFRCRNGYVSYITVPVPHKVEPLHDQ